MKKYNTPKMEVNKIFVESINSVTQIFTEDGKTVFIKQLDPNNIINDEFNFQSIKDFVNTVDRFKNTVRHDENTVIPKQTRTPYEYRDGSQ
jgi:hypothetical protein